MSETEIQDSDKKVNIGKKTEDNPMADSSSSSKEKKRSPKRKGPKFNRNDKKKKSSKDNHFKEELLGPPTEQEGILEISGKGFGFLREPSKDFRQTPDDVFVTPEIVRNFGLRDGLWVKAETRMGRKGAATNKAYRY